MFSRDVLLPAMAILDSALSHNIRIFADYCRSHGVWLAPHGKTTMTPAIHRRQLDAGAWGITVANVAQATVCASAGTPRILIANEVVDEADIAWIDDVLTSGQSELWCFVDSFVGVRRLGSQLSGGGRQLAVLVEVGPPGGRAGCRTLEEALAVARVAATTPELTLAGVAFFEGAVHTETPETRAAGVDELLAFAKRVAIAIEREGLFPSGLRFVVSGGGSEWFARVVDGLSGPWPTPVPPQILLRSGSYVTHDHRRYELTSPFGLNAVTGSPRLRPAIEVWAAVLSVPEPGVAICGAGRRNLPYDAGLPIPIKLRRNGGPVVALKEAVVDRLNDQHAYVTFDPASPLEVGDRIGFGVSHPCSAFDRWRSILLVDDDYRVLDVLETSF
jgi:D-serine deaminase-like pyridoxal phosphate-dependent protein